MSDRNFNSFWELFQAWIALAMIGFLPECKFYKKIDKERSRSFIIVLVRWKWKPVIEGKREGKRSLIYILRNKVFSKLTLSENFSVKLFLSINHGFNSQSIWKREQKRANPWADWYQLKLCQWH